MLILQYPPLLFTLQSAYTNSMHTTEVHVGRIGGLVFTRDVSGTRKGTTFVIWNQWRSGARSLLSRSLSELLLQDDKTLQVVCLDRIASGGMSTNTLTKAEKAQMRKQADMQFAIDYAEAVRGLGAKEVVLCGSSGGGLAVLATLKGLGKDQKSVRAAVLVEPTGLRAHGVRWLPASGLAHGLAKHAITYRHRLSRGWWRPMDREQYFAKGAPLEQRGLYFVQDHAKKVLTSLQSTASIHVYLSSQSHMHRSKERQQVAEALKAPHKVTVISGVHDKICQPPQLVKFYLSANK